MSFYEIVNGRVEVRGFSALFETRDGGDFDETQHPRDDKGKFAPTGDAEKPTKENVNELLGGAKTTTEEAFSKNGVWTPERQALHDAYAESAVRGKESPQGRAPVATVLGGGTASGKTTASREIIGRDPNIVRIDPDEIKLGVPEYSALKEADPMHAAARVHDESSTMTNQVLANTVAHGLDLTYDATTSNIDKAEARVNAMSERGYQVQAVFVDVPLDVAKDRADLRARESNDPMNRGRFVPTSIIEESHAGAAKTFLQLKDNPRIYYKALYDNSQPQGQKPTLIYERQGMGEEHVYDAERWQAYQRKAGR